MNKLCPIVSKISSIKWTKIGALFFIRVLVRSLTRLWISWQYLGNRVMARTVLLLILTCYRWMEPVLRRHILSIHWIWAPISKAQLTRPLRPIIRTIFDQASFMIEALFRSLNLLDEKCLTVARKLLQTSKSPSGFSIAQNVAIYRITKRVFRHCLKRDHFINLVIAIGNDHQKFPSLKYKWNFCLSKTKKIKSS